MNKFFSKIFFFCLSFFSSLSGLTTSVIVTCNPNNIKNLPLIIEVFNNQCTIPNEMIISLYNATKIQNQDLDKIKSIKHRYKIKLIPCSYRLFASESKNNAVMQAFGDLILLNDTLFMLDSHRIEKIKKQFENQKIDILLFEDRLIAIRKKVFDIVKWPVVETNEDEKFIEDALEEGFFLKVIEKIGE